MPHTKHGGGVDCEAEGFDIKMREATFGDEYRIAVGHIHEGGERWSYEELVRFAFGGLVEWYCRKLGTDLAVVTAIPEMAVLGAFFHRFKIVDEYFWLLERCLTTARKTGGLSLFSTVPTAIQQRALDRARQRGSAELKTIESTMADWDRFGGLRVPINIAIDRTQCLLFYICKHEKLPDGFVMDPRIAEWAHRPIEMDFVFGGKVVRPLEREDFRTGFPDARLAVAAGWITFFEEVGVAFAPEVTFGVF